MGYIKSYRRKDGTFVRGHHRGGGSSGSWTSNNSTAPKGNPWAAVGFFVLVFLIHKACN